MEKDLVRDYLEKSGMNDIQADALSRIFDHMATKSDLRLLEQKLENKLEALKSELTWRMVAIFVLLGTVMTLVDVFID